MIEYLKQFISILDRNSSFDFSHFKLTIIGLPTTGNAKGEQQIFVYAGEEEELYKEIGKKLLQSVEKMDKSISNEDICRLLGPEIDEYFAKNETAERKKRRVHLYCQKNILDTRKSIESNCYHILWMITADEANFGAEEKNEVIDSVLSLYLEKILKSVTCYFTNCNDFEYYAGTKEEEDFLACSLKPLEECRNIMAKCVRELLIEWQLPDYETLIYLSSLTYEKEECQARVLFEKNKRDFDAITFASSESNKILPENGRKIRKLLQMASKGYILIASQAKIEAIVSADNLDLMNEEDFLIEFNGHMRWKIARKDKEILGYKDGGFYISNGRAECSFHKKKMEDLNIFTEEQIKLFGELLEEILKTRKGAIMIVTPDAEEEAKRLCDEGRGISINAFNLSVNKGYVECLAGIDGAFVVDKAGICYGVGLILDGKSCKRGDMGRGSRYNSSMNYIYTQDKECTAFVISDDGMINIETNGKVTNNIM